MATRKEQRQLAKKKDREKRVAAKSRSEQLQDRLAGALAEVDDFVACRDYAAAELTLKELLQRWPNQREVLSMLIHVQSLQHHYGAMAQTAEQALQAAPNDPDVVAQYCFSKALQCVPGMASQAIQRFLERWPNHSKSTGLRDILVECEQQAQTNLTNMGFADDPRGRLALEAHETVFQAMQRGELERVIQLGEAAVSDGILLPSIFNNLTEACFHTLRWPEGLNAARRAMELEPSNVLASFNVVRFSLLLGDRPAANETADHLRSLHPERFDFWCHLIGAFLLLERYDDALRAAEVARQHPSPNAWKTPDAAELHHAIGVALAKSGREKEAEQEWRAALKVRPDFSMVRENLDDFRRPVAERDGAFYFSLEKLIPRKTLAQFSEYRKRKSRLAGKDESAELVRYLEKSSELRATVPLLLRIGNASSREVGMLVASALKTPDLLSALSEFALSNCGSDAQRFSALGKLRDAGVEVPPSVRFFSNGRWTEIEMFAAEITNEATGTMPDRVEPLFTQGMEALKTEDFQTAERLFREVIALEPTLVSAHNNLAASLHARRRFNDAKTVLLHVLTLDENNATARSSLARLALEDDDESAAREWLKPLRSARRFHTSEFVNVTGVDFELALRSGRLDLAEQHLQSIEQMNPRYPYIPDFRARLRAATLGEEVRRHPLKLLGQK